VCSVDFEIKRVHEQSLQQAIELFTHLSSYKQSSDIDGVKTFVNPQQEREIQNHFIRQFAFYSDLETILPVPAILVGLVTSRPWKASYGLGFPEHW